MLALADIAKYRRPHREIDAKVAIGCSTEKAYWYERVLKVEPNNKYALYGLANWYASPHVDRQDEALAKLARAALLGHVDAGFFFISKCGAPTDDPATWHKTYLYSIRTISDDKTHREHFEANFRLAELLRTGLKCNDSTLIGLDRFGYIDRLRYVATADVPPRLKRRKAKAQYRIDSARADLLELIVQGRHPCDRLGGGFDSHEKCKLWIRRFQNEPVYWLRMSASSGYVPALLKFGELQLDSAVESREYAEQHHEAGRLDQAFAAQRSAAAREMSAALVLLRAAYVQHKEHEGEVMRARKHLYELFRRSGDDSDVRDTVEAFFWGPNADIDRSELKKLGLTKKQKEDVDMLTQREVSENAANQLKLMGSGSGVRISANYLITNRHVVYEDELGKCDVIRVGKRRAKLVFTGDNTHDLALFSMMSEYRSDDSQKKVAYAKLLHGDMYHYRAGQAVYSYGFPGRWGTLSIQPEPKVTDGMLAGPNAVVPGGGMTEGFYLEHTAAIRPGNSGGPLMNSAGEVIGINAGGSTLPTEEAVHYAISTYSVGLWLMERLLRQVAADGSFDSTGDGLNEHEWKGVLSAFVVESSLDAPKSGEEIVELAAEFTVPVTCWRFM